MKIGLAKGKKILGVLITLLLFSWPAFSLAEQITFGTNNTFNQPINDNGGNDDIISQQFTPTNSGNGLDFTVHLKQQIGSSMTGKYFLAKILNDDNGAPSSTIITSYLYNANNLALSQFFYKSIVFSMPYAPLVGGKTYHFTLQMDNGNDTFNYPIVSLDGTNNPYNLDYGLYGAGSWATSTTFNLEGIVDIHPVPSSTVSVCTSTICIKNLEVLFLMLITAIFISVIYIVKWILRF